MPKLYDNADSVEAIASTLIPNYHSELVTARIRYVFVDKASMKAGVPVAGKARKMSGAMEFLTDADFVVEVALDVWNEMTGDQRTALVDHLLEYCTGEEDEEDAGAPMKWKLREPDVKEFGTVLRRQGAWNESLAEFASVARQIDLSEIVEETSEQVATLG